MHTFETVRQPSSYWVWVADPETVARYPEYGTIMVDGHLNNGPDDPHGMGPDCNLTGEPMVWDDANSRYAIKARAILAQQVDGFHL